MQGAQCKPILLGNIVHITIMDRKFVSILGIQPGSPPPFNSMTCSSPFKCVMLERGWGLGFGGDAG